MKYLTFIIFIAGILALSSCKDSLGYDPNVYITPVSNDTIDKPKDTPVTAYRLDSIRYSFLESIKMKNHIEDFPWFGVVVNKNIKIDTAKNNPYIYIELGLANRISDDDPAFRDRIDRVVGFDLLFGNEILQKTYNLNLSKEAKKWFNIRFRKIRKTDEFRFSMDELNAQLTIFDNDKENGILKLSLNAQIPEFVPIQTKRFSGIIYIYYKKK